MSTAKEGDQVKVHFTGKMADGEVFASSYGHEPLEFKLGDGEMLPGLESAVLGMATGEKKTAQLSPEQGYGPRVDDLQFEVEKNQFPDGFEAEAGMQLQVPQPDGSTALLTVLEVGEEKVKLDANHPLAGEKLTFELELLEIA